jgi:hypothetical protein
MKKLLRPSLAALLVFCSLSIGFRASAADACLTCHESMSDKASTLFKHDVHRSKGLGCVDCHGGDAATDDMEKAMDKGKGFIGVPKGDQISEVCARCHADGEKMKQLHATIPTTQFANLRESVHGRLATSGKERIVQCITCHNAHGIVPVKDSQSPVFPLNVVKLCTRCHADAAFMQTYNPGLAVDQLEKYRTSVHGKLNAKGDAKPAECASCHGSHLILSATDVRSRVYPTNLPGTCAECHANAAYMKGYGIPTDQYEKFTNSVHGVALLQKHDLGAPACNKCHGNHGATPPGVESISKVCGTCHALNAELFSSSPHKKAFDEQRLPECETCHGKHDIVAATNALLGVAPDAVCSKCHSAQQRPKGYVAARTMRGLIDSLENAEGHAKSLVEEAEQRGMEIAEPKFKLREIRQARMEARTKVHAFNEGQFREVVAKGFVSASVVQGEAQSAIDEYYFRRIGLGVATLIITIVAISLYIFIRRLERNAGKSQPSTK